MIPYGRPGSVAGCVFGVQCHGYSRLAHFMYVGNRLLISSTPIIRRYSPPFQVKMFTKKKNHGVYLTIVKYTSCDIVRLGSFQNLYLSFAIVEITHGVTANRDDTDFHHAKPQILHC